MVVASCRDVTLWFECASIAGKVVCFLDETSLNINLLAGLICANGIFTYIDLNRTNAKSFEAELSLVAAEFCLCTRYNAKKVERILNCEPVSITKIGTKEVCLLPCFTNPAITRRCFWKNEISLPFFAYLVTTSGTTSCDKRVIGVPNICIDFNIKYLVERLEITNKDVILVSSPLSFDPSIVQILLAFNAGCSLLIPSPDILISPRFLKDALVHSKVTIIQATPSLIYGLGDKFIKDSLLNADSHVRWLIFGGEPCPPIRKIASWKHRKNSTRIGNIYGVSEVSCWQFFNEITEQVLSGEDSPIALNEINEAMPGTEYMIIDTNGDLLKGPGYGQLFVGGPQRVCHVISKEIDTDTCSNVSSASLCNRLHVPDKNFRDTGDLVKRTSDGKIYFEGRIDNVVKLKGRKKNLTLLDNVLNSHSAIRRAVSIVVSDDDNTNHVISFAEVSEDVSDRSSLTSELRRNIMENLSADYLPRDIVLLESKQFSLTGHTKLNVRDLAKYWRDKQLNKNHVQESINGTDDNLNFGTVCSTFLTLLSTHFGLKATLKSTTIEKDKNQPNIPSNADEINLTKSFVQLGGDSLSAIYFLEELSLRFRELGATNCDFPLLTELLLTRNILDTIRYTYDVIVNKSSLVRRGSIYNQNVAFENYMVHISDSPAVFDHNSLLFQAKDIDVTYAYFTRAGLSDGSENHSSEIHFVKSLPTPAEWGKLHWSYYRGIKVCFTSCDFCQQCRRQSSKHIYLNDLEQHSDWAKRQKLSYSETEAQKKYDFRFRWSYSAGKCVDASPLVAQFCSKSLVVVGSHSHWIGALEASTGTLVWEQWLSDRIESSAVISPCGKLVVTGCYDGRVYVLRLADGEVFWSFKTADMIKASPVIDTTHNACFISSYDGCIYALKPDTRQLTWTADLEAGAIASTPCVSQLCDSLFCATLAGSVFCVLLDNGVVKWRVQLPKPIFAALVIDTSGRIHVACADCIVYCIDSNTANILMTFETQAPIFSSPVVADNGLVVCSQDLFIYFLNISNYASVWKRSLTSAVYATPCFLKHNGSLILICCSSDGTLSALDVGEEQISLARVFLPHEVFSSPAILPLEESGYGVFVGCRNDCVLCFDFVLSR